MPRRLSPTRIRNAEIGNKDFKLDTLEEAYTTEHWLVRIYKVKDLDNRGNWFAEVNESTTLDNERHLKHKFVKQNMVLGLLDIKREGSIN